MIKTKLTRIGRVSDYLPRVGGTMTGDIVFTGADVDLGANLIKTTNAAIKETDAATLGVRNRADAANLRFQADWLKWYDRLYALADGAGLYALSTDGAALNFYARDTGGGNSIIGKLVGAADPFMCFTGILATIPLNTNLPTGFWTIGYATGGNATLYVNDAGTIKSLVLGAPA